MGFAQWFWRLFLVFTGLIVGHVLLVTVLAAWRDEQPVLMNGGIWLVAAATIACGAAAIWYCLQRIFEPLAELSRRVQAASALWSGPSKKERSREDLAVVLRLVASMLRDLEAINAGADASVLANPVLAGDLESLARAFTGDRARDAFGAVDRALTALERNAGTKLVAEWLAVQV